MELTDAHTSEERREELKRSIQFYEDQKKEYIEQIGILSYNFSEASKQAALSIISTCL